MVVGKTTDRDSLPKGETGFDPVSRKPDRSVHEFVDKAWDTWRTITGRDRGSKSQLLLTIAYG
jgi:hypothetical protein